MFRKDDTQLITIAHFQLGYPLEGSIAYSGDECRKCKVIEIKNGKLLVNFYAGTYALYWDFVKIEI